MTLDAWHQLIVSQSPNAAMIVSEPTATRRPTRPRGMIGHGYARRLDSGWVPAGRGCQRGPTPVARRDPPKSQSIKAVVMAPTGVPSMLKGVADALTASTNSAGLDLWASARSGTVTMAATSAGSGQLERVNRSHQPTMAVTRKPSTGTGSGGSIPTMCTVAGSTPASSHAPRGARWQWVRRR